MTAIVKANLCSAVRRKPFRICLIIEIAFTLILFAAQYAILEGNTSEIPADTCAFIMVGYISIFHAYIVANVIGTDYANGTIRNKMIAGFSRMQVYLAGFFTLAVLLLVNYVLITAVGVGAAYMIFDKPRMTLSERLPMLSFGLLTMLVETALFTLVAMLARAKASAITLCLILAFAGMMIGSVTDSCMYDNTLLPDFYDIRELPVDLQKIGIMGDINATDEELAESMAALDAYIEQGFITEEYYSVTNDNNYAEPARYLLLVMSDLLPASQLKGILNGYIFKTYHICPFGWENHAAFLVVADLALIAALNALGCAVFGRMKLK